VDNAQQAELSFQWKAMATFQAQGDPKPQPQEAPTDSTHSTLQSHALDGKLSPAASRAASPAPSSQAKGTTAHSKHPLSSVITVDSNDEMETNVQPKPSRLFVLMGRGHYHYANHHLSQKEMCKTQQPGGEGRRQLFDGHQYLVY
jgi:hypothetical protein